MKELSTACAESGVVIACSGWLVDQQMVGPVDRPLPALVLCLMHGQVAVKADYK